MAQKYIICAPLGVFLLLRHQSPAAVRQLSAASGEREDSERYLQWRGGYITLWCHALESFNHNCFDN